MQAHAERNTWQEVLPFVQKVYGDIEHSPAAIVQLWWVEQAVCYMYGGIPVYIRLFWSPILDTEDCQTILFTSNLIRDLA